MTDTVIPVKPVNPSVKLLKDWSGLIAVVLIVLNLMGFISLDQVKSIGDAIKKIETAETTTEKITVETTTKPAKLVEPVVTNSVEVAAIKPEDIKQWLDLIRIVIDEIKPKPAPVDPKPEPKPIDPKPVDPVIITPSETIKIIITDEAGKEIVGNTVDSGMLLTVMANTTGEVVWNRSKHGSVHINELPNNQGYSLYLEKGATVEIFLSEGKSKTSKIVAANEAPRPPPNITPVVPDVDPESSTAGQVSLRVVFSRAAINPDTAIVMNSTPVWNSFITKGSDWLFYETNTTEPLGIKAKSDAAGVAVPALVVYDKLSGVKLAAVPLPKTVEELKAIVAKYTGK